MSRRARVVGIVGAIAVVAVVGVVAAFLLNNNANTPKAVTLSDSPGTGSATSSTTGSSGAGAGTGTGTASGGLAGTWKVQASGRTFVGYRVGEKLAQFSTHTTAVGRTPAVSGTLTATATTVTAANITADLSQLKSDQARRDNAIKMRGLETANFPSASFKLTSPIRFGTVATGKVVNATATGDLTLHGVTKSVQFPLQGKYTGSTIEVVGLVPIQFADYQIQPPTFAGFVTVDDNGMMELDLVFTKSA